jgi:oligopeptide transport system ATP-binding protein
VLLSGRNLAECQAGELMRLRRDLQMVFQDPYASLNPRMTVFATLAEPLLTHGVCDRSEATRQVAELMERVGLAPRFMQKYPHEFSGGQRQRIAIARALALRPQIIIADEPVSALDVSIQAQILNLLAKLVREMGLSLVFIAHDLSLVSAIPRPDPEVERNRQRIVLPGDPPSPINPPSGCTFHPRCPHAIDACKAAFPELRAAAGREVACSRIGAF